MYTISFSLYRGKGTLRIIQNLKNKTSFGHDSISNILLWRSQEVLYKPLIMLINQTITTGYFPQELKLSRVKPLNKIWRLYINLKL